MSSIVEDLRRQASKRRICLILGAGVSIATTGNAESASWVGLLRVGVQRCRELNTMAEDQATKALARVETGEADALIEVAEQITEALGGMGSGEYRRWLGETVGSLPILDRGLIQALERFGAIVVTTNYDTLFERVTDWESVEWRDRPACEAVLKGETRGVIHLHGVWNHPRGVVLGQKAYEEIRNDEFTQLVMRALRLSYVPVMVGFGAGIDDPNFGPFIAWAADVFRDSTSRIYRLVLESELPAPGPKRDEDPITQVSYGAAHADLAGFIRSLVEPEIQGPPVPPKPPPEPPPVPREPPTSPWPWLLGIVALVLAAGGMAWWFSQPEPTTVVSDTGREPEPEPEPESEEATTGSEARPADLPPPNPLVPEPTIVAQLVPTVSEAVVASSTLTLPLRISAGSDSFDVAAATAQLQIMQANASTLVIDLEPSGDNPATIDSGQSNATSWSARLDRTQLRALRSSPSLVVVVPQAAARAELRSSAFTLPPSLFARRPTPSTTGGEAQTTSECTDAAPCPCPSAIRGALRNELPNTGQTHTAKLTIVVDEHGAATARRRRGTTTSEDDIAQATTELRGVSRSAIRNNAGGKLPCSFSYDWQR